MSTTTLAPIDMAGAIEKVLISGDLGPLTPEQRVTYYHRVCDSLGLNPLTKPFAYIKLNDKLQLYTLKDCTDQLRARDRISIAIVDRSVIDGVYVVTARASTPDGRIDESTGAVPLVKEGGTWEGPSGNRTFKPSGQYIPLKPEDKANAYMKAETKAKRRVTLSFCGLGMLDESEAPSIPGAQIVPMDDAPVARVVGVTAGNQHPDRDGLIAGIVRLIDYPETPDAYADMDFESMSDSDLAKIHKELTSIVQGAENTATVTVGRAAAARQIERDLRGIERKHDYRMSSADEVFDDE